MTMGEDSNPKLDQKKWAEWTMHPKKEKEAPNLAGVTSAIVLLTSAVHVLGFYAA